MDGSGLSVTGTSLNEKFQKSFAATVASFTTSNTSERASDFHATIEWGDGSSSSGIIKAERHKGEFSITGIHAYSNGLQDDEIMINVSDKATGQSSSATTDIHVLGAPVELAPNPILEPYDGQPFVEHLAFLEVDSGASDVNAAATVTYPDGTSEADRFGDSSNNVPQAVTSGDYEFPESTPRAPPASVSVDFSGSFVYHRKTLSFNEVDQLPVNVLDSPLTPYTPPGTSTSFTANAGVPLVCTLYFLDANTRTKAPRFL
jgi:hypothetical protein